MGMRRSTGAVLIAAVWAGLGSGCGEAEYCSARDDLQKSVGGLSDVQLVESGGVEQLKSQLREIEEDAREVVDSAKGDFPEETKAVSSSLTALESSLNTVPDSPSAQDIAQVGIAAKNMVDSVTKLVDATSSEC